jgi:hypothetical protein
MEMKKVGVVGCGHMYHQQIASAFLLEGRIMTQKERS